MLMPRTLRRGFTLIELLIVVAIIAILAAIAVPNFLEAQTRARVSRTDAELRTIALAMECYRVDNDSYPPSFKYSRFNQSSAVSSWMDPALLSSPISYITEFPYDIFRKVAGHADVGYRIYTYAHDGVAATNGYESHPKNAWMTWSLGPDNEWQASGYRTKPYVLQNEAEHAANPSLDPINCRGRGMRYDPTNGTISCGEIFRWDGIALTAPNFY